MNASEDRPEPILPESPGASAPAPQTSPPPPQAAEPPPGWRPAAPTVDPRRRSPVLACILSLVPGLGQVYVGYYKLGFIHITVFSTAMAISASNPADEVIPLIVMFMVFFFLYNIVDAGRRAAFYNQALAGIDGMPPPADLTLPSPGGSVAGGVALVVIGTVLLSYTLFGFSLAWLENWWPLAPIVVGLWLVWRGVQERAKTG